MSVYLDVGSTDPLMLIPTATVEQAQEQLGSEQGVPERRPLFVRLLETLKTFWYLGFVSFGGPAAHIALFQRLFVEKLAWLDATTFSQIFAVGQALPGPGSTQMLFIIATFRNGISGGALAFLFWSLPGFVVMTALAVLAGHIPPHLDTWAFLLRQGISSVAIGLVAAAGLKLSIKLIVNTPRDIVYCWGAAVAGILGSGKSWTPPVIIATGGLVNYARYRLEQYRTKQADDVKTMISMKDETIVAPVGDAVLSSVQTSIIALAIFSVGLISSFIVVYTAPSTQLGDAFRVICSFYITGSVIFGGGPVVIPLLYSYVVVPGWISADAFLFGFALINIMPGPNFNFGAYCAGLAFANLLGVSSDSVSYIPLVIAGAVLGFIGIFFPGLCVKVGILPLWKRVKDRQGFRVFLEGVSCCAVGLIFSTVVTLWLDIFDKPGNNYWFATVAMSAFVGSYHLAFHTLLLIFGGAALTMAGYFLSLFS